VAGFEDETFDADFDYSRGIELTKKKAVVLVLTGAELGKRFPLNGEPVVIGRNPAKANMVISDRTVSGIHSRIDFNPRNQEYTITDLESRNGILVNFQKTESSQLNNGDKIFIGATVLKFTYEDDFEDKFHSKLNQIMNIDDLTGLPVKRIFDREYKLEFFQTKRNDKKLSLLMMDMDGLKQINDTYGHQMGSFSISESGKIIRKTIGRKGIASRYGGDEFIAFLRNTPICKAESIGESIREKIINHDFTRKDVTVSPTISIGVAEFNDELKSPEDLVRVADEALYRAKRSGRNTVSR
jgi:two-component system cell cycle response regulator